jgi:hypothetical protein
MRKTHALLAIFGVLVAVAVVQAAQDTTLTQKQVRNPKYLETYLEANATDAETRLTAVDSGVTLSSTASYTDTWGINGSRASQTGQYAVVELLDTSATNYDTDAVTVELFEGVNDSAEATVWGSIKVVVDDNTTNTEDSAIEVYQPVAGVATKVLDISANAVTVPGTLTVTGAATLTETPVFVSTQAAGSVTPAATNAPTLIDGTVGAYIKVNIGGEVYVITAYQLDD